MKLIEGAALTAQQKKDLLHRLARVEAQLRGVQKCIAEAARPADCDAAAQAMAAARKAFDRAFAQLLTSCIITQTANAQNLPEAQATAEHLAMMLNKLK